MPDQPWPPGDLASRQPRWRVLPAGQPLHRFYSRAHDPIYFDRSRSGRLNAPDGSHGVLYTAEQPAGAFAETFLRAPGRTLLPTDLIAAKARAILSADRELRLVELHGPGLAVLGATAEVTSSGLPYDLPHAWSKAVHDAWPDADGISYRARHDNDQICFALFDRTESAIAIASQSDNLDADWFYELMDIYGVGLTS
ncbi:RES family NAD+ phosphorylase [Gluconacetobacter diazotrophicus]|uniref:RES family NAD+ phosphorylase n=1 Tax=Gluconacetobacter diazotrophicus TaxID=33996 RepID=A0A7W4I8H4_GLUDI|nr:RES family NAD+ phosphorylase [Gluconacetobacter diazotrophicus]MBB2158230.1 RES family NAD+ phosphorylase [Gluconacetobacter diazotrophicus]